MRRRVIERPGSAARRRGLGAAASLLAFLVASVPAATAEREPFSEMSPLERSELAALRGGFFTPEGLEISFAVRLQLDIEDKLRFTTRLRPNRELEVEFGDPGGGAGSSTTLKRRDNGSIEIATGDGPPLPIASDGHFDLPDGSGGSVAQTSDGLVVSTDGGVPVTLDEGPQGLEVTIGDAETTFVRDQLGLGRLSAQVVNRQDDAAITHRAILDVDVHNFSDLAGLSQAANQARRLRDAVSGGLSLRTQP